MAPASGDDGKNDGSGGLSVEDIAASLAKTVEGQEDTDVVVKVMQEWNLEVTAPAGATTSDVIEAAEEQCRESSPDCEVYLDESRRSLEAGATYGRATRGRRRLQGGPLPLKISRALGEQATVNDGLPFASGLSVGGSVAPVATELQAVSAKMEVTQLGGPEDAGELVGTLTTDAVVGNLAEDLSIPAESMEVAVSKPIFPPMPPPSLPPSPPSPPPPSPPPPAPPPP